MPIGAVVISCGPMVMATGCLLADIDTTYYLVEMVFPPATERTMTEILVGLICRFAVAFWVALEITRTGSFLVTCGLIASDRAYHMTKMLICAVRDFRRFYHVYTLLRILLYRIYNIIHSLIYLVFSASFWMLVLCIWICVKCSPQTVSLPIYFSSVVAVILLILVHYFGLRILCGSLEMAKEAVHIHMLRCRFVHAKRKSYNSRLYLRLCESILPIRLKYGAFWYIDESLYADYLWSIQTRCFDAILIVDIQP